MSGLFQQDHNRGHLHEGQEVDRSRSRRVPSATRRSGLVAFADWLALQRPRVLPKSAIGEAVTYASNQYHTLGVYLTNGRLTIDKAPAEQAIRPLCVSRRNWLHLGGDGGLQPTAVLLSITASIK